MGKSIPKKEFSKTFLDRLESFSRANSCVLLGLLAAIQGLFSVVTVIDAVSAAILPVWVDFTSLKGLPCAPGPATTRRGMLVTNG